MAEIWLTSLDGTMRQPTHLIGPYGAIGDLSYTTRFGAGACGMFEATWTMPLPPDFDHPLLRRGTLVELMDGPYRIGSPLILTEPARGSGLANPWTLTASGVGNEVLGQNSFYALDGSGDATSVMQTAIDQAIARGLRWSGRDASIFAGPFAADPPDDLYTLGNLLGMVGDYLGQRWGVGQDNVVGFLTDPTAPMFHITPDTVALGVADDDYATRVLFRYINSTTHLWTTAVAPATPSAVEGRYGTREVAQVAPDGLGEIDAATAQALADGILAKYKGRLGWTNGLTVTSNEILTAGGVPADLSMVAEAVGTGCMVRLHGIFDDLLETTGNTWLDVILGEAKYADGALSIDLSPLGLAARDLASVVESVTGMASAA